MKWKVGYTAEAKRDLRNIYEYIAYSLLVPETAAGQVRRIMEMIRALDEMPERYQVYDKEPWCQIGLRYFPVDNYLVFYLPNKNENTVDIVRIMYSGRDVSRQLNEQ